MYAKKVNSSFDLFRADIESIFGWPNDIISSLFLGFKNPKIPLGHPQNLLMKLSHTIWLWLNKFRERRHAKNEKLTKYTRLSIKEITKIIITQGGHQTSSATSGSSGVNNTPSPSHYETTQYYTTTRMP